MLEPHRLGLFTNANGVCLSVECTTKHEIPFQCSVAVVLSFLQDLIDQGKAFSTIKVFLAAISACHIGFDNKTVGQHPLICRFMKGVRCALPVSKPFSPSWDLRLVLDGLSMSPFEPLDKVDFKILSFKTALLVALVSAKRVSEIHAFSVHSACLQFMSGDAGVVLKPNPAFMLKVVNAINPLELIAFYPRPFASSEQQKLNTLCPVRALRIYTERTRGFRGSDQLFVSWMRPRTGKPITKQRLSHWIVEAISLAYSSKGLVPPPGLRAHSTRGMSTSWALFKGVTLQDTYEHRNVCLKKNNRLLA
ncbi:Signal recognition particle SEC65 subunit [Labeo rohita]|uniref:Signal recognition particle SEC65 subunit n=1 Tax=Labeo rohita TaxID=84645 RepID=A0ABQ8MWV2_LABRO|nr:Signal recognition particle SEC65 subunit [Labeo rohita]